MGVDGPSGFRQGDEFRVQIVVDERMVDRFAAFSGDDNPIHMDAGEARSLGFPRRVAHGAILVAHLSRLIGKELPGPGALWLSQTVEWLRPVFVGDEVSLGVRVENVSRGAGVMELAVECVDGSGRVVMRGTGRVKVTERLSLEATSDEQRVALVTGGSRGIGAAVAARLAAAGMCVGVGFRSDTESASTVVATIREGGGVAQAFQADLADPGAAATLVEAVRDEFGGVDVLVHAASPPLPTGSSLSGWADVEPYLRVFVGSAMEMVKAAAPGMGERRSGRIVFLGTSALFGIPPAGWGPYVVAKQALLGLTRSLATELGPQGITVNMVSPGLTVTDLTADVPARVKEVEARRVPLRRLPTPDDTAGLVAFLATSPGGYVNGAHLPVTGGPV
jgi:3-oxoacyl-[acyl-carrier protein] reductase